MKIYTKTGDKGETSLVGGTRVPKNSLRLEAYGGIDELNSYIGMIRSFSIDKQRKEELIRIQHVLFYAGCCLATDPLKEADSRFDVKEEEIVFLENAIDTMEPELPPLRNFVLPGGDQATSFCHIARTVCRRVERRILDLNEKSPVSEQIIRFINRLSDYLFQLSRYISVQSGITEIEWDR